MVRGVNKKVMLIKKENVDYKPNLPESDENRRYTEVTDRQGIIEDFYKAYQKTYAKQNVDDRSEDMQDFLGSGNDTMPSEHIINLALSDVERDKAEGEITLEEMPYSLFKKMKGS